MDFYSVDSNSLASDAASLNSLKQSAAGDPAKAVRQAANEFEALFARQLLKSMRDAMPTTGLFDGPGKRMYEDMLDDQLSRNISGQKGGLGDMLARHLSRYMGEPGDAESIALNTSAQTNPITAQVAIQASGLTPTVRQPNVLNPASDPRISMASLPDALRTAIEGADSGPAIALARTTNTPSRLGNIADTQTAFVERMWPHARKAEAATGVPAAFVVGQAALESGWGRGEIRHGDGRSAHNLFGIKATGDWNGNTVDVTTTEYENGRKLTRVEKFRAYPSYADAFNDWVGLMTRLPRYAGVLNDSNSPQQFANGLQQAGYATDPQYGSKLEKVIQQTIAIQKAGKG
ncbi:MAG: flagellar assembly peptidoglycan hydrolase FlgJ [Burkholderiaceae bacterium]